MSKIIILLLLILPTLTNAQFKTEFDTMNKVENPNFNDYDKLVYEATKHIFSNNVNSKSEEFLYAIKITQFWMDKDTVFPLPTFGIFFSKLTDVNNERFFYTISLMHYNLIQKIDNNRLLKCLPIEGKKFFELPEIKEIQIESAKIFLNYVGDEKNNFKLNPKLKVYVESMKEGELESIFFEN